MASFTGVGDNVEQAITFAGETIDIALSGTYNMQIDLQREVGAPGSGAWQKVKTVSTTANATVADIYTSQRPNETIRLIVIVDTSGTCTATLTDNETHAHSENVLKDPNGNTLLSFDEEGAVFPGDIEINGGIRNGSESVVNTTAALTLTRALHAGRVVTLNSTTGRAITLPEATGTGDVYTVFIGTTVSSGNHTIVAPSASTSFIGGVGLSTDIAGVTILANTGDDTVTMNGTTTGGLLGSWVRFTDVASGIFMLEGFLCSSGVEADPFSAAV